jgi:hypothetical protein
VAAEVPTKEPLEFRAGDTVLWTKTLADYPAGDGWALTYYLVGATRTTVTTTADGDDFSATIPATTTATLQAGQYFIEGYVSKDAERFNVYSGDVKVKPDFGSEASVAPGYDGRSHARKCRDALRAMMENISGSPVVDYTIFGERNVKLMTVPERLQLLGYYENLVRQEEDAAAVGRGERKDIYIRFRSPR